ncbi:Thioester-containing protein 2, isoform D [Drosophila ananassae]|uniref:CD109 antigen n=1 Tax=Drosophila ananassae TaxID=7217 RepID=A0A0P8XFH6_DROAN|nr:CD109 antigen isoform X2 [Drosophila ananassae]KPU73330.1 Thioester-containing protein 2, isoform D [Drosophila ananassae]
MMRFILCVFLLQYALLINATGLYSVVGPGTIRSNSKYNVAVSVHKAEGPSKINVSLNGPSFNETKEIEVLPMATENVEFEVPKLASGDYNLTAVGVSGVVFRNTTKLNHADEKPSVFVQTDKATYKPADLVQFRVLFLDENTRPARIDGTISVVITDGAQNRIKQISNVKLTKGVYTGELQLSEQPVLGTWKLAVNVDGEARETKTFEVDKYVLPKFEVKIDTAKDVVAADNLIKATIRAKYTYGKPVKGKATVSLESNYGWSSTSKQEKTIDVDGKGHVEFNLPGSIANSAYIPPYKLFAVVTEELTGNKQNATATVNLHQQRYKLQSVDSPTTYKPSKSFVYQVAVKNVDDSPVLGSTKKVKLFFDLPGRYFSPHYSGHQIKYEEPLNENGIATFQVTLPANVSNYYAILADFDGVQGHFGTISKFQESENREPLTIKVNTKKPRLGEKVSFDVISTGNIPYFVYTIVARGNIVLSDYIVVPEDTKKYTVKFTPTFDMVPQATIYIHYVIDNDLKFEEKTIDFEKDFSNSIDIVAPVNAKPSEEVKLKVKTDADSFVGLLGVDQSVLLLKSGNDFNKDDIFNSLNKYKTSTPWLRGYGRYPGQTSGLVTLTNANYPYNTGNIQKGDQLPAVPIMKASADRQGSNKKRKTTIKPPTESTKETPFDGQETHNDFGVRSKFSETWIYELAEDILTDVDDSGFTLTKKIPDTITSWVITGFSLNPTSGIALTKNPSMIRVFQPFFVSTNLPYSVKRGEVISVPVVVFNYLDKALDVDVTMDNSDGEYEFTEATNDVLEKASDDVQRTKRETVPANSGKSLSFMIRPKNVGTTTLKITATSPLAGDTIHQKLKVEPEGVTQFENRAVFINLKDQPEFSQTVDAEIPQEAVPQSEFIEFSVVGDLLGPTLQNLDNLVRMPYGCGEQNMVNFVPNILVLKYLEVTGRRMPAVETKAKKFLEIGYQRELTYKHDDGSYSAFGKSDKSGSTWLTAYVMRSFHQAGKYTDVDPKVVIAGLDFLVSKQKENGEFPEVGKLFDNANQNSLALTSFVLLAFFENYELIEKYQSAIQKGVNYVAEEVDKSDDLYSLAIAVVALQLAKHPQAEKVLAKLETLARQENDRKWWSKVDPTSSSEVARVYWKPRSNDVEITSYVLLALLEKEAADKSLPIIKWLIAQRNSNGGFSSTQDTVIGLQALTKFAYKTGSGSGSMDIEFTPAGGTKDTIKVNPENSLVLQTHVLPKNTRKVDFTAKGTGSAMVQLSYRYNLAEKEKKPSFKVTPTVKNSPSPQLLDVDICAEFVPLEEADKEKDSNMAVMEIALPSGFVSDSDTLDGIQNVDRVKRVETKNSDSTVIVYFDSLTPGDVRCLPVKATKAHAVAKQKPASVSLYDYYDTERRATEYYQVASSLCDICQGSDCGEGCKKSA